MKKKIDSMADLAQEIGVSRPTLSKYFQDPASIRKSTREKIEKILEQVDYVPNFFASNMNRKKTKLFGIVVPHLNDLFYTSLIQEIEIRAAENGYALIVQNSHGNAEREIRALEALRSMNASGVIIAPVGIDSSLTALKQLSAQLPLVFVDSQLAGLESTCPFVGTNNAQTIRLLVDYLCRSGQPPVFLGMPKVNCNSKDREAVYCKRMQELGHEHEIIPADQNEVSWEFEQYAYQLMLSYFRSGRYTEQTILCANDRLAIGTIRAANECKLWDTKNTAQQFRVAGHDDYPMAGFVWPSLTTVSQDTKNLGQQAFDLLIAESNGDRDKDSPAPKVFLDGNLILRNSA